MANDPRNFLIVSGCERKPGGPADSFSLRRGQTEANNKREFFESLGNVGDLEVLNDLGYGTVAEGLRTLSSVSESVRTGQSVVPGREGSDLFNTALGAIAGTALDNVNEGANVVLGTVGINPNVLTQAGGFSAPTANRAYGAAQQVFQQVKEGNFQLSDIPSVFSDLQNLETLTRSIFVPPSITAGGTQSSTKELCNASEYATDLIAYAPKFKFLFIVQFVFNEPYNPWTGIGGDMAFVVKNSTRPNVQFEYEDVNMYNFWTKVPKRTIYQPMTMRFYDDNQNNANLFYTAYMRAMSPIANIRFDQRVMESTYEQNSMNFEDLVAGTTFGEGSVPMRKYSASLGPLHDNYKSILSEIRLFHVFDYGRLMNIYRFYNPRITQLELDEVNMADNGDGNEVAFDFAYDGMYVSPNYDTRDKTEFNIKEISGGDGRAEKYAINPVYGETAKAGTKNAPSEQEQIEVQGIAGEILDAANGIREQVTGITSNAFASTAGLNSANNLFT